MEAIAADLSHDKIAEQIEKQVILKVCDAYGLRVEDWSGTLTLDRVLRYDGSEVRDVKVPVVLQMALKEGKDDKSARGVMNSSKAVVKVFIRQDIADEVSGVFHVLRSKPKNFSAYCSTIVHELTHLVEFVVNGENVFKKNRPPKKASRSEEYGDEYYTSETEFNAFLRQAVYLIETRMSAKLDESRSLMERAESEKFFNGTTDDFLNFMVDKKLLTDKFMRFINANRNVPAHWAKIVSILGSAQKSLRRRYDKALYSGA